MNQIRIWALRNNSRKKRGFNLRKYFKSDDDQTWIFYDKTINKSLFNICNIPIKRFIKVRSDKRIYDTDAREYWIRREYIKTAKSIFGSHTINALFGKQKGKCEYCKQPITETDVIETAIHKHHMKPRSEGGDWKLGNLRLLHTDCHISLHSMYSRKIMAKLSDSGINYVKLIKR